MSSGFRARGEPAGGPFEKPRISAKLHRLLSRDLKRKNAADRIGPVAELLDMPDEYTKAVEAAIGCSAAARGGKR